MVWEKRGTNTYSTFIDLREVKFVQREMGDAAEVSSGGGDRGLLREVISLLILSAVTVVILYFLVIGITELVVRNISPQKEQELFKSIAEAQFKTDAAVPEQFKEKFELCQAVLDKLVEYEEVPDIEYKLIYLQEIKPNAFAIPGGSIGVTRGLLNSLDEEIAIAFVLAHELGHFYNRDHLRGVGRNLGFSIGIRAIFGGSLDTSAQLILAKHSRNQESKADDFGIRCVLDRYGNAEGAEALFRVLEEKHAMPDWAYMFSTHPDNKGRIRKILEAAKQQ